MIDFFQILGFTILSYLVGAIPTVLLISKLGYGLDLRHHGDGKPSHSNLNEVIGWKMSIVARTIDFLKGFLVTAIAYLVYQSYGPLDYGESSILMLTSGLAVVLGHIFPVFANFQGGKGFHCIVGVLLAVNPYATLACALTALIILLLSRYPVLAYWFGILAAAIFLLFTQTQIWTPIFIFTLIALVLVSITYRDKIGEIFRGDAEKFSL